MNMYIWTIGTLNQLFIRDSYTQIKFSKKFKKWQTSILCDGSISHSPFNFCLNIGFCLNICHHKDHFSVVIIISNLSVFWRELQLEVEQFYTTYWVVATWQRD